MHNALQLLKLRSILMLMPDKQDQLAACNRYLSQDDDTSYIIRDDNGTPLYNHMHSMPYEQFEPIILQTLMANIETVCPLLPDEVPISPLLLPFTLLFIQAAMFGTLCYPDKERTALHSLFITFASKFGYNMEIKFGA